MKSPLEVVCPTCQAALGAKCTERYKGGVGMMFKEIPCAERVEKAKEQA